MRSLFSVPRGDRFDRLEEWAAGRPARVGRYNVLLLLLRCARRIVEVRVTGLAAEMTYFALISLIPLVTALGAALGFTERVLGPERVAEIEQAVVDGLASVFDPQVTADVLAPFVQSLLREERTGVAIGSVALALWLASRMFRAAIRALDDAYKVPERRSLPWQWVLGLALALGAVITLVLVLSMVVVGPLLGGVRTIAAALGQAEAFDGVWGTLRWPLLGLVPVMFLAVLYRFGPNVRNRWRDCLPGAVVGSVGLLLVAVAFQTYLDLAGPTGPDVGSAGQAVEIVAQTIGAVLAGVLWLWLSSIVILSGGVLNAEMARMRECPHRDSNPD